MPTELNSALSPQDCPLSGDLADDLTTVVGIIRDKVNAESPTGDNAVALVRIVQGTCPGEWASFAFEHGLDDWLCISLKGSLADAVDQLVSIQEDLAFQRDHDHLTGIGNRGYFNRRFAPEVYRAVRTHGELSLLFLDLDNFKQVNDTYGHDCGDEVLKRLAKVLQTSVRHYDIIARLGGEEFCVLFPSTSCWTALMLGNRLLELFSQEVFECDGQSFSMTFSGGVSSLTILEEEKRNCQDLLKSADEALYEAKRKGKNNITLAASGKLARDQGSLVQAQEKQFLFSALNSEEE